jgi:putative peptide zinc metalloprotease protein
VSTSIRNDLKLFAASANRDGSPAWVIHDPVNNRFVKIGLLEFELISRWELGDPRLIAVAVRQDTMMQPTLEQVAEFEQFLRSQNLLRLSDKKDTEALLGQVKSAKRSVWNWLLHNYLFIRVPLVRPGEFFKQTSHWVAWAFSSVFWYVTIAAAVLGLFLTVRQWDGFVHTITNHFTLSGLFAYALAMMFAKTLHELGHAYTASRHGCRVAHMGVAFLVLWPMLYTDTGEAWKLSRRKDRFQIAAAGIAVELALAAWSTLAWCLAPDGAIRDAFFFLATTSWVLTLTLNASPFMRFDGYFLLSDALDLPNLHERSGSLARTWVRKLLLGSPEVFPAEYSHTMRNGLIGFALITWLYRLVIFFGIALAVYYFFFKVLGIILFVVEIVWFILRPMWAEVRHWPRFFPTMPNSKRLILLLFFIGLACVLLLPLNRSVYADGWLHAERQHVVYSPLAGQVTQLLPEGNVAAGTLLAVIDSPDARAKSSASLVVQEALIQNLDQLVGMAEGQERRASLLQQIGQQLAEAQAQASEQKRLELAAPFAGQLFDLDLGLRVGAWVNPGQPIAMLVDTSTWVVDALVEQNDLDRIQTGARAKVYLAGRLDKGLHAAVASVDSSRAQSFVHPMLAAEHGGNIVSAKQANGQLMPRNAYYRVRLILNFESSQKTPPLMRSVALTKVVIDGSERSFLGKWLDSALSILIRESGF